MASSGATALAHGARSLGRDVGRELDRWRARQAALARDHCVANECRFSVEVLPSLLRDRAGVACIGVVVRVGGGGLVATPRRHRGHERRASGGSSPQEPLGVDGGAFRRATRTKEPERLSQAESSERGHDDGRVVMRHTVPRNFGGQARPAPERAKGAQHGVESVVPEALRERMRVGECVCGCFVVPHREKNGAAKAGRFVTGQTRLSVRCRATAGRERRPVSVGGVSLVSGTGGQCHRR